MKTIVWDVDDVLNDLMRAWLEQGWRPAHPGCTIAYAELRENPPHAVLGIGSAEYLASLDRFRLSPQGAELAPIPAVHAWFSAHGARFRHVALTATPLASAPLAAAWVLRHFGPWIRSFNVVPSAREGEALPAYDQNKGEYLKWWGRADVLVDDSPRHVAAAQALGLEGVLVPRPWNGNRRTLQETLEFLTSL